LMIIATQIFEFIFQIEPLWFFSGWHNYVLGAKSV
jgi:hypothetical protein